MRLAALPPALLWLPVKLATGEKGNFKFTLQPSATGYIIAAVPLLYGASGTHTFYSDESGGIHYRSGQQPATAKDPLVGDQEPR